MKHLIDEKDKFSMLPVHFTRGRGKQAHFTRIIKDKFFKKIL